MFRHRLALTCVAVFKPPWQVLSMGTLLRPHAIWPGESIALRHTVAFYYTGRNMSADMELELFRIMHDSRQRYVYFMLAGV